MIFGQEQNLIVRKRMDRIIKKMIKEELTKSNRTSSFLPISTVFKFNESFSEIILRAIFIFVGNFY